jgi:hypothetical protein
MQASNMQTSYFGKDGSIAPILSMGRVALAPSMLTGDGSHANLWTSVVLHVAALVLTITANSIFIGDGGLNGHHAQGTWAFTSTLMFTLAVLGTIASTAFVRDVFAVPMINTLIFGLFLVSFSSTVTLYESRVVVYSGNVSGVLDDGGSDGELVSYLMAMVAQAFALSSILANAACALANKGGI